MERGGGSQRGGRTSQGADFSAQRHSQVNGQHIVTLGTERIGQFSSMQIIHDLGSNRVHTENNSVCGNFANGRGRGVFGMRGGRTGKFRERIGSHREPIRSEFQASGRGDFDVGGNFGALNNSEVEAKGNLGRQTAGAYALGTEEFRRTNYSEARVGGSLGQQGPNIQTVEAVEFNTYPSEEFGNIAGNSNGFGSGQFAVQGGSGINSQQVQNSAPTPSCHTKGKNFRPEEERQLTLSYLAISQNPIVGNQQKSGAFWRQIHDHYKAHRPFETRPERSLETKWGSIKHDDNKFIGNFAQILSLNKSGANREDLIRMVKTLYRQKCHKNTDFMYEHCWELVKNHPRWAEGWGISKPLTPQKQTTVTPGSQFNTLDIGPSDECRERDTVSNLGLRDRPIGTKKAKAALSDSKGQEMSLKLQSDQAEATRLLAEATFEKNVLLKAQNLLLLMTTVTTGITPEGRRFLQLCQSEELANYEDGLAKKARLTEEAGTSSRGPQQYCAKQNSAAQAREDAGTHREAEEPGNSNIREEGQEYNYVDLGEDEEFGNPLHVPNLNISSNCT